MADDPHAPHAHDTPPLLSVVVPALDERDNVAPLADEVERALSDLPGGFELIVVDDGSTDGTGDVLLDLAGSRPWLRVLRRDVPRGQSSAMKAGIAATRGAWVAMLDADLQNDPADLPQMLALARDGGYDLVQGDRSRGRRDSFMKRRASVVGRVFRRGVLGDRIRDTGCSARVFKADVARQLPLEFKGMHRFIPAYVAFLGGRVAEFEVRHRERTSGVTKYGVGVVTRGAAGLADLVAVRWMAKRVRDTSAVELMPGRH